jgi:dTMP kinase
LEGGEGCGKSTQAAMLASALGAVATREPGGTSTGERIRSLLLDPDLPAVGPRTETMLMLAARAQHVHEVIEPALAAGRDVVCDRFSGSTIAYQGYGRGLPISDLETMSAWAAGGIAPDLVILLRVAPEVALGRRQARGAGDRFEGEAASFFARIEAGFAALASADPQRWVVIDGSGPVQEVAARVASAVEAAL